MNIIQNILEIITGIIRQMLGFLLFILVIVFVGYIIITFVSKYRKARMVSEEQNVVLVSGKATAKGLKLNHLYSSDNNKKTIKLGKIASFVKMEEDDKTIWHIFAVKKGFGEYHFYKVQEDRHSNLFSDVILYDWNFRLDEESKYLVNNSDASLQPSIQKRTHEIETGVDTIGLLAPSIHKAVQVNPLHRIQIRITKLIKIPDESALAMATQQSQSLEQGGGE